ncbi:MAG: M20/M25/M40 family metallo-hydrolase [Acidobacteria bacterium]|nr:M20/M25/M40 family metallo-hydrolase [Acidobacteriota bacterium]
MSWSSHSVNEIGATSRSCGVSLFRRFGRAAALFTSVLLVVAITPERAGATAAETSGRASDPASRLAARMLADTPLAEDLQFLCDRIGGRLTGSDACERSVDWFVERFRQAGVDHVSTESFEMPWRWSDSGSRASVLHPESISLDVVALPNSPGTSGAGLTTTVVDLADGGEQAFERAGARLEGALGLLDSEVIVTWPDLFTDYMRVPPVIDRAKRAGMAGLLLVGSRAGDLLYRHIPSFEIPPFPMAVVAREDGLLLQRLTRAGTVRMKLDLGARIGPSYTARNVVAEIRGRERPDEVVLLGAHLDSWDLGTGALDNGANCAMLLEVARQMVALGQRPRRSVRVVLFTGEEQGLYGSLGYVQSHRDELDRIVAVAIFDEGTGRIGGFSLGGRDDLRPFVERALEPVSGYGATTHTVDAFLGTDNFDFLLEGVPNLVATQAASNYMDNYHASSDTFDKVDLRELRINGAIVAALAWNLADDPERPSRHDRAAVKKLLGATGVDDQMKTFGLWDDWFEGKRGRQKR